MYDEPTATQVSSHTGLNHRLHRKIKLGLRINGVQKPTVQHGAICVHTPFN